ncbi:MAG: GIY-YIG nuclease family protein [Rickettsiales bacterium]|nr:GIY-YIG nuclease family protein [Rickettsiales bacterium]
MRFSLKTSPFRKSGYVYIMASDKMGTLYIGSTSNLIKRVSQHKAKTYKGFTSEYDVDKLVYYEYFEDVANMAARERQLKEWQRNWKIRLIVGKNPEWKDLYEEVRQQMLHNA